MFHLIIDHSKSTDNVQMLTEVGEQELLNLIQENAEVELILNEVVTEEEKKTTTKKTINVSANQDSNDQPESSQSNMNLIIIIAASVITGWYFKINKPKREMAFADEIYEADYIDHEETINEDDEA